MADRPLTYRTLERGLWKRALGHSFARGQGGALAFVWALGAGALAVVFQMPVLAGALTGVMVALEAFMARGYLHGPETRTQILRAALARHLGPAQLADETLRAACARSADLFVELAGKVEAAAAEHGANEDLKHVLGASCELLALQHTAAVRVEEYSRILDLLERGRPARASEPAVAALREQNLRTLKTHLAEERLLVTDVVARLETALLQVLQVTRGAADLARTADLAHEADEKLRDLQAVVEARRETADLIRRTVTSS